MQLLGTIDGNGRITEHGRKVAQLPLHPRLAHMLVRAGPAGAPLAALLADRDPTPNAGADLKLRLNTLASGGGSDRDGLFAHIRREATRLAGLVRGGEPMSAAEMAALAYPDRIGVARAGPGGRFHLSGGRGAAIPEG